MNQNGKPTEKIADQIVAAAAGGAALLSLLILLFNVVTHFPFYDETVHVHYLWELSIGMKPGTDFLCIYPVLGYLLSLPFLRMFPESAFVILGLRFLSVILVVLIGIVFYRHGRRVSGDWTMTVLAYALIVKASALGAFLSEYSIDHMAALSALSALLIMFREPRPRAIALASALATVSVVLTPKYPLPLVFAMLGHLLSYFLQHRRIGSALAAASAGVFAAAAVIVVLYWANGISLSENIRHSYLLQYRWSSRFMTYGFQSGLAPLLSAILAFFRRNPVAGIIIAVGLAGWARRSWRNPDAAALTGAGLLLGILVSSLLIKDFVSQYLAPRVFCLVFFVPYISSLLPRPGALNLLRLGIAAAAIMTLTFQMDRIADNFDEVPLNMRAATKTHTSRLGKPDMAPIGILALSDYDAILDIVPDDERVVAVWPYHPVFRRDQTQIATDDLPSYATVLPLDDPMREAFNPYRYRESLENTPPALINMNRMRYNYPPGWQAATEDFLRAHGDWYAERRTRLFQYYLRRDLVERYERGAP